jgi:hypothetical protein
VREVISSIAQQGKRIAEARADLRHKNACIALFDASDEPRVITLYIDVYRIFTCSELIMLCKKPDRGPKSTTELALYKHLIRHLLFFCRHLESTKNASWREGVVAAAAFRPSNALSLLIFNEQHLLLSKPTHRCDAPSASSRTPSGALRTIGTG